MTLNRRNFFIVCVITKYIKNDTTIQVFQVSLFISVKKNFLAKAFLRSEIDIYQTLRLNYYKKLEEWWTDDVDGDCINFKFYGKTEKSFFC